MRRLTSKARKQLRCARNYTSRHGGSKGFSAVVSKNLPDLKTGLSVLAMLAVGSSLLVSRLSGG